MPVIVYILPDGSRREVTVSAGTTVMTAAIENRVKGIVGDCGGTCSCATCHVYVEGGPKDLLEPVSVIEDEMLEGVVSERKPDSRLSCQITMSDALSGITVRIPDRQN
jgi:2Fe-2S ferredoxin